MGTNVPESFAIYYQNSNEFDTRKIIVSAEEKGEQLFEEVLEVTRNFSWYKTYQNPKNDTLIKFKVYDLETDEFLFEKQITVNPGYIKTQLPLNGYLEVK
jgi:5-formyltetrahydrofolate cyclo-ligase